MSAQEDRSYGLIIDSLNCARPSREQIQRTLAGHVVAINLTIVRPWSDFESAMVDLGQNLADIHAMRDIATIACSAVDIREARREGRLAIIMGTQNSTFIETDLSLLRVLYRLGFRILQPTYNERNRLGDGATVPQDQGLTDLGRQWVHEMNRLGMVIDLSHCGYRTSADAINESEEPVIFSHANALSLCKNPRNKPDELIRAIADKGGVIGAVAWAPALSLATRPSIEDYFDQVDYMVNLAGIDHVSFASDLAENVYSPDEEEKWERSFGPEGLYPTVTGILGDWWRFDQRFPVGYESLAQTPKIWDGLKRRGYNDNEVEKVMGRNILRVFREVWEN